MHRLHVHVSNDKCILDVGANVCHIIRMSIPIPADFKVVGGTLSIGKTAAGWCIAMSCERSHLDSSEQSEVTHLAGGMGSSTARMLDAETNPS